MERDLSGRFIKGGNINDLSGEKFGRLTVLCLGEKRSGRKTYWKCKCECGTVKEIRSDTLKHIRSCGCLKKEQDKINLIPNSRHRESHSVLHNTWLGMKARCSNKNLECFPRYGGRGIQVCDEWNDSYESFRDWSFRNGFSEELTIERIDVNGNYEPNNCKWIPFIEQANNRQNTIWVEFDGRTQNLMQWCKELGLPYGTIHHRYKKGYKTPDLFRPIGEL